MNFEDEEEWDLDLIDNLVRQEEEAIAARRGGSQATQFSQPPLPFLLKQQVREAAVPLKTQSQLVDHHHSHHHHDRHHHNQHHRGLPPEEADEEEELKYTVSQLRQRVLEAEKEVEELRRKALRPIVISSSNTEQELERLREQILFKDQEILEARRAWTEKTEELKRVKCEVQDLRKQFDEHNLLVKREEGRLKTSIYGVPSSQEAPHRDAWNTPWKLSGPDASKSNGSTVQSQTTHLERLEPSAVKELKMRTSDNGCSSSSQKDAKLTGHQIKLEEIPKSSKVGRENKEERKGVTENGIPGRYVDPEKLLKIWQRKGMKRDGVGLISKLFTACQGDIQVLLSKDTKDAGDTEVPLNKRSSKKVSDIRERDSSGCREAKDDILEELDLHSILAKIANGFLSSWSLFVALLELCDVGDTQTLESTLRILHCVLIHDEGCRNKIFGRRPWQDDVSKLPEDILANIDFGYRVHQQRSYCSPRIYCFPSETQLNKNEESVDNSQEEINKRYAFEKQSHAVLIMTIFKRILHNAKNCCSEPARTTAMSILVLLLMNTEPLNLRESFGFILFDGTMSHFLRKSAGMEVQSQAVRIVHILLHCPSILRKLCTSEEKHSHETNTTELRTASNMEGKLIEQETSMRHTEMATGKRKLEDQPEAVDTESSVHHNGVDILKRLISCLIHAGSTLQTHSLQRNVLRVLTFIATSGQQGAQFLLSKDVHFAADQVKENSHLKKGTAVVPSSLPVHLMYLLDEQLKAEEGERISAIKTTEMEERECIIHEALTLLCRLASNPVVSVTALANLTTNKAVTRFSITVANKLISRGTLSEALQLQGKHVIVSADMIELSRGLRRRILENAPHHQG